MVSYMGKTFSLNLFLFQQMNLIIKNDRELLFDCNFLEKNIKKQYIGTKLCQKYMFKSVWFGPRNSGACKVFDFWLKKKEASVGNLWESNFDTDWSYQWLAENYHIPIEIAQYAVHCISCILAGYQCSIDPAPLLPCWGIVWPRDFNIYLSRRYKYIGTDELWLEHTATARFCRQFPNTNYNQETISHIEYGLVSGLSFERYGLKLKSTNFLLSQMVLSYLDPRAYPNIKSARYYVSGEGYRKISISASEFDELILLVYALIDDYNFAVT